MPLPPLPQGNGGPKKGGEKAEKKKEESFYSPTVKVPETGAGRESNSGRHPSPLKVSAPLPHHSV